MALTNEEVQQELQDMKTKVYLPSSYNDVAARFAELVTNHLNDETRDAFFGWPIENCPLLPPEIGSQLGRIDLAASHYWYN